MVSACKSLTITLCRSRKLEIAPIQFIGGVNSAKPGDEKFDRTFERWKAGGGLEVDGPRGKIVQIIN